MKRPVNDSNNVSGYLVVLCDAEGTITKTIHGNTDEYPSGVSLWEHAKIPMNVRGDIVNDLDLNSIASDWNISVGAGHTLHLKYAILTKVSKEQIAVISGVLEETANALGVERCIGEFETQLQKGISDIQNATTSKISHKEIIVRKTEILDALSRIHGASDRNDSRKEVPNSPDNKESDTSADLAVEAEQNKIQKVFEISDLLSRNDIDVREILKRVARSLNGVLSYSELVSCRIHCYGENFDSDQFKKTKNSLHVPITLWQTKIGFLEVFYPDESDHTPKLEFTIKEQQRLTLVASRLTALVENRQLIENLETTRKELLVKNEIANVFLTDSGVALYKNILWVICDEFNIKSGLIYINDETFTESYQMSFPDEQASYSPGSEFKKIDMQETVVEKVFSSLDSSLVAEFKEADPGTIFAEKSNSIVASLGMQDGYRGFIALFPEKRQLNEKEQLYLWRLVNHIAPTLTLMVQRDSKDRDRLRAQIALQQSEERYRSISEGVLDSFYLLKCVRDDSGEVSDFAFVDLNKSAEKELSTNKETLLGKNICDVFPVNRESGFFEIYKRVYETRKPYEGEYHIPSEYAAPGWYYHQVSPTLDGVAITNRDITARKNAEQALLESEEKFREVVESTADLILQFDIHGRITYANHAIKDFCGVRPEAVVGKQIYEFVHHGDTDQFRTALLLNHSENKPSYNQTARLVHVDGSMHFVLCTINLRKQESGQSEVVTMIGQDITGMKRYEEELRASEERFKAIVSSANEAILMVDLTGKIHFANQAASRMLTSEHSPDLTNRYEAEFFPEDQNDSLNQLLEVGSTGKAIKDQMSEMVNDEGERFPAEFSTSPIRNSSGEIIYRMSIIRDVKQRQEAELALKDSERKYRTLVENIEEGIGIVDLDDVFLFVNQSACNIFGAAKQEIIGKRAEDFVSPAFRGSMHMETALRKRGISSRYELVIRRKDTGENRNIMLTASPRIDGEGKVVGTFGIFFDITDKKAAEEELKRHREQLEELVSERTTELKKLNIDLSSEIEQRAKIQSDLQDSRSKYRLVVENSTNAIAVLTENKLEFVNPRFMEIFSLDQTELESFKITEWLSTECRLGFEERITAAFEGYHSASRLQLRAVNQKGEALWLESNEVPIEWEGKPAVLLFFSDITREKIAQLKTEKQKEQLIQADKMTSLGTLVAGVAHEINNPNNYILLSAQTLAEAWKAARPILEDYYQENGDFSLGGVPFSRMREKIVSMSEGVFDSSLRIKDMVNSLKDYARQGSGDLNQEVDINKAIQAAVKLLENLLEKSTDRFIQDLQISIPTIRGNTNQIVQVFVNIIQNACEALQSKKDAITVKTYSQDSESVIVELIDEGVGIPKEHLNKIADPFFTTKRDIGGTGLGLSVSSRIIKDHGASMHVSPGKSKGTIVEIRFQQTTKVRS